MIDLVNERDSALVNQAGACCSCSCWATALISPLDQHLFIAKVPKIITISLFRNLEKYLKLPKHIRPDRQQTEIGNVLLYDDPTRSGVSCASLCLRPTIQQAAVASLLDQELTSVKVNHTTNLILVLGWARQVSNF